MATLGLQVPSKRVGLEGPNMSKHLPCELLGASGLINWACRVLLQASYSGSVRGAVTELGWSDCQQILYGWWPTLQGCQGMPAWHQ